MAAIAVLPGDDIPEIARILKRARAPRPRDVGRLVDPDMGGPEDTEAQAVAFDTGELMGLSAEEAAMHLIPEKEDE